MQIIHKTNSNAIKCFYFGLSCTSNTCTIKLILFYFQGKYFGPDSPVEAVQRLKAEDLSPLSSEYSSNIKSQSESGQQYLADNSDSCSGDEDVVS